MVFRTVSAIAALMIWLGASGEKGLAQYYPPVQAYPPPQAYPPQGYYPRQGYRPPVVDDEDDDDMVYDLEGRPASNDTGLSRASILSCWGFRHDDFATSF
jgi:hypothetical protein